MSYETQMLHFTHASNSVVQLPRKLLVLALVALSLFSPLLCRVEAAAGNLDAGFGSGGKVVTDFFGGFEEIRGIAIQPDGKIVAGGVAASLFLSLDFAVARYNSDGSLDASFGTGGKVATDFDNGSSDEGLAITLQPNGKIVLAGYTFDFRGFRFAVVRYNHDGSLDSSFGTGGKVATAFGDFPSFAKGFAITLQPDGRIIVAGFVLNAGTRFDFALARYNSDGSLDTNFGVGGRVITDFDGGFDSIQAVLIQPDNKIVAGGASSTISIRGDFALARYNSDGSLDFSFGSAGKVITDLAGPEEQANDLVLQPDGKIVAAGSTFVDDIGLVRYNVDGSLDSTFGVAGIVTTRLDDLFGSEEARALALQSDGKFVVAGDAVAFGPQLPDFRLLRYDTNGSLDATFGSGGIVTTDFSGNVDQAQAVALQSDGKIVVAGSATNLPTSADFSLARYIGGLEFDFCLQDDSTRDTLQVNSTTGNYQFTRCRDSLVLSGTGTLIRKGNLLTLQHNSPDRRILAKIDASVNKGTASIQVFALGTTFTIIDRNTSNNRCACS